MIKNKIVQGLFILCSVLLLVGCEPLADGGTTDSTSTTQTASQSTDSSSVESRSADASVASSGTAVSVKSNQTPAQGVRAKIVKVVDGDTFQVLYQQKVTTVRVLLIDTPETHHPRLGVQPYGPEASAYAHQLLDGKTVTLELAKNGGHDKYGRLLAYVFIDGKSFEELQLARGLARVAYIFPPNTKYLDQYRAVEQQAREKKWGIWSVAGYAQANGYHPEVMKGTQAYEETKHGRSQSQTTGSASAARGPGQFSPDQNGNCKGSIKGNISERGKIYHMPSDRYYKVTKAEICFQTRSAATKAGFRAAQ
ncbi:thermonuclease family protein [Sporolactobacillus kofuensis]|uniref:Thermonuclease family protein n=1 Tax=Sporolactobacillus kofuensis TaxID=269672 RepID=A0ABW1WJA6_9BACL|nr:thermonuclease family protein [Sporolactobacillus kofuensis]MCO7176889.1 thermonuclease family protein [Sporolactobacillus kofuensis]